MYIPNVRTLQAGKGIEVDVLFGSVESIKCSIVSTRQLYVNYYLLRGQSSVLSFQPRVSSPI
jgi:hypothetical protein